MFTGCGDGVVRAYDAKSGALKRHYTGHEGAVNCLVVARDKIFSGSSDASLRVWDAKDLSEDLMLPEDGSGAAVACVGGGNDTLSALARDLETPKEEIEDDPDIVVSASGRFFCWVSVWITELLSSLCCCRSKLLLLLLL